MRSFSLFPVLLLTVSNCLDAQDRLVATVHKGVLDGNVSMYDSTILAYVPKGISLKYPRSAVFELPQGVYMSKDYNLTPVGGDHQLKYLEYNKYGQVTKGVIVNSMHKGGEIFEYYELNDTMDRVIISRNDLNTNEIKMVTQWDVFTTERSKGKIIYNRINNSWERKSYEYEQFDSAGRSLYRYTGDYVNGNLKTRELETHVYTSAYTSGYLYQFSKTTIDTTFNHPNGWRTKAVVYNKMDGSNEVRGEMTLYNTSNWFDYSRTYFTLFSNNGKNFFYYPAEPFALDSGYPTGIRLLYSRNPGSSSYTLKRKQFLTVINNISSNFILDSTKTGWDTTEIHYQHYGPCGHDYFQDIFPDFSLKDHRIDTRFDTSCRQVYSIQKYYNGQFETWYYYEPFSVLLNDLDHHFKLSVFPNPVKDNLNFRVDRPLSHGTLRVYDSRGRALRDIRFGLSSNIELDTRDLSLGIYFYRFSTDLESHTGRFIKSQD